MYTTTLILNIQNIFNLDANRITTKTKILFCQPKYYVCILYTVNILYVLSTIFWMRFF